MRKQKLEPLIDEFFEWATGLRPHHAERGLVATALGYAVRQEQALRRFLEDGRPAERGLRPIAVGRKNWLFSGSDDHAAAANLLSLIASAKLHNIEPERYLAELIRVVPHWRRERFLELAPKHWASTRARLDPAQLAARLGALDVPPAAMQQSSRRPERDGTPSSCVRDQGRKRRGWCGGYAVCERCEPRYGARRFSG